MAGVADAGTAVSISRKEFEGDAFDAKRWINAHLALALQQQQQDATASASVPGAVLSTLTMRLQLVLQDVEAALHQAAAELFSGLPKSALRTLRLRCGGWLCAGLTVLVAVLLQGAAGAAVAGP